MSGKFFVGNTSNIATLPKDILVGDTNNIARKVKEIYIGNSQNQAVKVWPNGRVPSEYQEVEYLMSVYTTNGFRTGIYPDSNTRIVITFMYDSISLRELCTNVYGFYASIASPFRVMSHSYGIYNGFSTVLQAVYSNTSNTQIHYSFTTAFGTGNASSVSYSLFDFYENETYPSSNSVETVNNYLLNKKITIDLNRNRGTLYYDDELKKTFTHSFPTLSSDITLLAYNIGYEVGSVSLQATENKIRLYSCQIYQNNVLVRDFIPCYNKQTYDVRLYDAVNNVFYTCPQSAGYPPYLGPDV